MFKNTQSSLSLLWLGLSLVCFNFLGHTAAEDPYAFLDDLPNTPVQAVAAQEQPLVVVPPARNSARFSNEDSQDQSRLGGLPDELLLKIFSHLALPDDFAHIAQTCKKFNHVLASLASEAYPLSNAPFRQFKGYPFSHLLPKHVSLSNGVTPKWLSLIKFNSLVGLECHNFEFLPPEIVYGTETDGKLARLKILTLNQSVTVFNLDQLNRIFARTSQLKELTLRGSLDEYKVEYYLSYSGAQDYVALAVANNPNLETLSLYEIGIDVSHPTLADQIKHHPTLQSVTSYWNPIRHPRRIGDIIKKSTSLTHLELRLCGISDCHLKDMDLGTVLALSRSLKKLDFSCNDFTLYTPFTVPSCLQELHLRGSEFPNLESLQSLTRGLQTNGNLQLLDLDGSNLEDIYEAAGEFGEMLRHNKGLRKLNLNYTKLSDVKSLLPGLKENTTLEELKLAGVLGWQSPTPFLQLLGRKPYLAIKM